MVYWPVYNLNEPWKHAKWKKLVTKDCMLYVFHLYISKLMGFPGGSVGKESTCNAGDAGDRFSPWVGKIPWRTAWLPTPVFLPGQRQGHGQRRLVGYSPQGHSVWHDWSDWECMQANKFIDIEIMSVVTLGLGRCKHLVTTKGCRVSFGIMKMF